MRWRRSATQAERGPSWSARLLVPVSVSVAALLCGTQPAYAHASLVGAAPAAGSTVEVAPTTVTLRFDENIRSPSVVIVNGPDGQPASHGSTSVVDNTASVAVTVTQPGRYTVAYRVLSSDGHPVADQISFGYRGTGTASDSSSPSSSSPRATGASRDAGAATESGSGSTRWVVGGVAVALVAAAALLLVGRRRQPAASDTEGDTTTEPGRTRNTQ